jgi:tellurite resistance protein TerC
MTVPLWVWCATIALVVGALLVDLFVVHRDAHVVSLREATISSAAWILLAVLFGLGVAVFGGREAGGEYFAGYVIEKALSVENIFVFALLLTYFAVPAELHHRVLFYGVLGALVLRAALITAGAAMLEHFSFAMYAFGVVVLASAWKMARAGEVKLQPDRNPLLRLLRRVLPVTDDYRGTRLFVREHGIRMATPLLAVLVTIETSDVVFALDSIPAIFAVTDDGFVVLTSNAFAILGLRALYFVLAGAMRELHYLRQGLAVVLAFVAAKLLLADVVHVPIATSLLVIATVVGVAVAASLRHAARCRGSVDPVNSCSELDRFADSVQRDGS